MTMATQRDRHSVSPAITAFCAWIVPGGGYWVLGQKVRAAAVGVSVILLFVMGILIGGIRVMDPPGWGDYGYMTQIVARRIGPDRYELRRVDPMTEDQAEHPATDDRDQALHSALSAQPLAELSDKPWFVGQILCGPVALAASVVSVHAARPTAADAEASDSPPQTVAISHARSWEIGTLYTAVAGMLNLLAIIDASFRSEQNRTAHA